MQKIINNLATITYRKEYDGIEVMFTKPGDLTQYDDTMDLALNMAEINQCDKWMMVKKSFEDINIDEFLLFISNWILNGNNGKRLKEIKSKCKIAILTNKDIRSKIKVKFDYLRNKDSRQIDLKIFDDEKDAVQYLKQGFLPLLFTLENSRLKKKKQLKRKMS